MLWRTPFLKEEIQSDFKLNHSAPVLSIGSCFATNISTRLNDLLFRTYLNPTGISFNPVSISDALYYIAEDTRFDANSLFFDGDMYHSWYHHSSFSDTDKFKAAEKMNVAISSGHQTLKKASCLIITLGTAQIYSLKENDTVVNNCHKAHAAFFERAMLQTSVIKKHLFEGLKKIRGINPTIEIILTVSPVRHTKMGLIENAKSKAKLIIAAHKMCEMLEHVIYFPAYEIMMDDLRDYRFYNADLIHPNTQAIDYIFEIFKDAFFTDETKQIVTDIQKIKTMQAHRPMNTTSEQYLQFQNTLKNRVAAFQKAHPEIKGL